MTQAFFEAGVPREAVALYPGPRRGWGPAVVNNCPRSLIFGGTATVEQYAGNPGVQVHGPGSARSCSATTRRTTGSKHTST